MKEKLTLVYPRCEDAIRTMRLRALLEEVLGNYETEEMIETVDAFGPLKNRRIIFAIPLGISGVNLEYCRFLKKMRTDPFMLEGSVGGIIIDGESELYTKSVARGLIFTANQAGCTFPGRAMVEGTKDLLNYNIQAMNLETDNLTAYHISAGEMVKRVMEFQPLQKKRANILVLHASNYGTSNTVGLWHMIKEHLEHCDITEISLRNGTIQDCSGCPYRMCMHFSEKSSCYYGGVITKEVYPGILACDAMLILAPNYNDAVSANITAFINRLTALFRKTQFYKKHLFAVVVSGYSGGDIVAEQLISALSMNKTFRLPPKFAMVETANDPASILKVEGIEERSTAFAKGMMDVLVKR
ncbi:NAD(P)H-dependent oxidoreductase [Anaerotignum sp. MB30-C6]|uniref:NAD(P)H-dependent oxidoreductase n=1 Tax=Anaerotignum sp. MB30-C6 TaxID=3070814 RepID=UPI0027DE5885|nr:NAD(P)H-dependent oxidoreductase [Anaerotignum sp. MB30-C6]WMI82179.1 NAD(P)H-dependent oxidoreductase [Anaerotignum sp. MB30-C6]